MNTNAARIPSPRVRLSAAAAIAIVCAVFVYASDARHPDMGSDFAQLWFGARVLISGGNPYAHIGPGRELEQPWPLYYPVPALLAALPLSPLPLPYARAVFGALSGGLLSWVLLARGWWALAAMASGSALIALRLGQPVPLIAAVAGTSWAGIALASKPTGAAVASAQLTRVRPIAMAAAIAVAVWVATLVLWPWWLRDWLRVLGTATFVKPYVAQPLGWLLLLAVFRWREPASRVLLAFALVPTTPSIYDGLYLLAVPHPPRRLLVLALLSHVAILGVRSVYNPDFDVTSAATARVMLVLVYLPALVLVMFESSLSPSARGRVDNQ